MAHGSSPSAVCAQQCLCVLCYHSPGKSSPCPLAFKHRWVFGPVSFFSLLYFIQTFAESFGSCLIKVLSCLKVFVIAVLKSEHALIDTTHAEPFMSSEYLVVAQICCMCGVTLANQFYWFSSY